MADFNKVLEPGDYKNGELNVVIEIPTGSNHKIEWDREHACFMLDRVEPIAFAKPCNYGFIPQTIDEDGDELDVLMITDQPLTTGIWLKAKILGVMKFVDSDEVDDKIICVPADDRNNGDMYNSLDDFIVDFVAIHELDVLMITDQPLTTGIWLKAKILGVMKFVDSDEVDDKIICVPADDRNNGDMYNSLDDLPKQLLKQIEFHFNHYKDLKKPGSTEVKEFAGVEVAKKVIEESIQRWKNKYDFATIAENTANEMVSAAKKKVNEIKKKLK